MASSIINNMLGENLTSYFAAFGVIAASYVALKFALTYLKALKTFIFAKPLGLSTNFKKLGAWAVVTGSTDGIGKAYAQELARKGLNIVLISRSEEKLQDVAREIEKEHNVKTKIIVADFSKGMDIYEGIKHQLGDLEIGTLVNNVGLSYSFPNYFLDIPDRDEFFMSLIHVNVTSLTMMTSIVLPGMVERRKGAVINISSASGQSPTPLLAVYSACKAYVNFFTQCLQHEYGSRGITAQCVMPFFVATKMSKMKTSAALVPSPSTYVKSALSTVGIAGVTHGYWAHSLQGAVAGMLPEFLLTKITIKALDGARRAYLRKAAKKK